MLHRETYPTVSVPAKPHKSRGSMRDNSRNIAVRMTEEQYQRLQRYRDLTNHRSTLYFRKLIHGERIMGKVPKLRRSMYSGVNMIHSNVQQIAHCQQAREADAESVEKMIFLADRLCEEVFSLARQK